MSKKRKRCSKYSGFTTSEVAEITGVSPRQLRWWDKQNVVKPTASASRSRWQTRCYSLPDLICVLVIKQLREKGVSLKRIRDSVQRTRVTGVQHPLARLRVACLAHTIVFKKDGKYLDPISGQMVIEEALEKIRPHIERARLAPTERALQKAHRHYHERLSAF